MSLMKQKLRAVMAATMATDGALRMHEKVSSKKKQRLLDLLFLPVGFKKYIRLKKSFPSKCEKIAAVVIIKNEGPYIREWLAYHYLVGVSHFYIYDNESTDGVKEIIKDEIKSGLVDYELIKGKVRQVDAYNMALEKARNNKEYLIVIDADEFIFLKNKDDSLYELCHDLITDNSKVGSLAINWVIFGSSHFQKAQKGLVTQTYLYRSRFNFEKNKHIKTICNPFKVAGFINPHFPEHLKDYYSINIARKRVIGPYSQPIYNPRIRINHYFTKSKEEFLQKRARGKADGNSIRSISEFKEHDKNDVYDSSMKRYALPLEKLLKKSK